MALWRDDVQLSDKDVMFLLFRAITFATLFIALFLIYIPGNVLSWTGMDRPTEIGWQQVAGLAVGTAGAVIAVWCILAFATIGKGTPAPFDPPRKPVIRGPYRFVRNPMYIGATVALAGAAAYYQSASLAVYAAIFLLACHVFVVTYEEPALRRSFEREYTEYCHQVHRWRPTL